ncbi:DUF6879 family protein [Streptomyces hebeiensis]
MFDSFAQGVSNRLDRPSYHEDFYRIFRSGIRYLNKLERGQQFKERGFPSWEAFAAGEWENALSLIEEKREIYTRQLAEVADLGITQRRLRVVEFPVTPYVQWEFHVLRLRQELGDPVRVMDARRIADIERTGPVPEVVILGDRAMYEVVYDDDGNADGARRYTDPALIAETSAGFDTLYGRAEPFQEFFEREILPLGAPVVSGSSV